MLVYKCCSTLLAIFSYHKFLNYWLYFLIINFAWRPTFSLNMLTDIVLTVLQKKFYL